MLNVTCAIQAITAMTVVSPKLLLLMLWMWIICKFTADLTLFSRVSSFP